MTWERQRWLGAKIQVSFVENIPETNGFSKETLQCREPVTRFLPTMETVGIDEYGKHWRGPLMLNKKTDTLMVVTLCLRVCAHTRTHLLSLVFSLMFLSQYLASYFLSCFSRSISLPLRVPHSLSLYRAHSLSLCLCTSGEDKVLE